MIGSQHAAVGGGPVLLPEPSAVWSVRGTAKVKTAPCSVLLSTLKGTAASVGSKPVCGIKQRILAPSIAMHGGPLKVLSDQCPVGATAHSCANEACPPEGYPIPVLT
eukprot:m.251280 g.251280  ORF g.251280 m.251280 type:complete len:107 (+) comp26503_c0_seq5:1166-1486(+)